MPRLPARRWLDGCFVVLAVVAQVEVWAGSAQTARPVAAVGALLWTLPLLLRHRFPLGAPVTVFAVLGLETLLRGDVVTSSVVNPLALIAALWVAGGHPDPRAGLIGGAAGYASMATIILVDTGQVDAGSVTFLFGLGAGAWAIGRTLVERDRRAEQLELRADRLEREQETVALAERARIARELHDVIAHSLSVMTIQAGAARVLLDEDPERAREPLAAVEQTGHQAIGEMRRLLGVLRNGEDEAGTRAPQPGLSQLDALVAQIRSAGLPVEVSVEGEPAPLAPGADLTAYRVVQEALTNALRHAGAARAHVGIRYGAEVVDLDISNTGRVVRDGETKSGGYGLAGMRQRVGLYGGELDAGPRAGGGFAVRARIPTGIGSG